MNKSLNKILINKDLVDQEDCDTLIEVINSLKNDGKMNYTEDKRYTCQNYDNEVLIQMAKKYSSTALELFKEIDDKPMYLSDYIASKYEVGSFMSEHSDSGNEEYGDTVMTAVLYLNNNFEGGEIFFKEVGAKVSPKEKYIISFPGDYIHSVFPITSGERYIFGISFTYDPEYSLFK